MILGIVILLAIDGHNPQRRRGECESDADIPAVIYTRPDERERLIKFGKAIGRAIEELITIVSPSTFYRLLRENDGQPKRKKNPKGGQRRLKEIRELILADARWHFRMCCVTSIF